MKKIVLYNIENVQLLDTIQIEGQVEKINSLKNNHLFRFDTYMQQKGIGYSCYVKSYDIVKTSNSIKANFYRYMQSAEHKEVYETLFYRMSDMQNEVTYLFYVNGAHLVLLIHLIAKLSHKKSSIVGIIVSCCYLLCFPIQFFAVRILCVSFVTHFFVQLSSKEKLGFAMIILLLVNPAYMFNIGFVMYFSFHLIREFHVSKTSRHILQYLWLLGIQLIFFNRCYMLFTLLFFFMRKLNAYVILLSLLGLLFTFLSNEILGSYYLLQEVYLWILDIDFKVIGYPSLIWIFGWIITVIRLSVKTKLKYYVTVVILLVVQVNMRQLQLFGQIVYIDVGQGDSILIMEPFNGKTILIDVAGHKTRDIATETIYPVLESRGIKYLDYVIITHHDIDHEGGLDTLKTLIPIKKVIDDKKEIAKLKLDNIQFVNLNEMDHEDTNDQSIVLFSSIYNKEYIFMGDASKQVEKAILQRYPLIEGDVIKVGHHGSKTSSDINFLTQLNPRLALISVGNNNYYGHPHASTLKTLENTNTKTLLTMESGEITIYFSKYLHFFKTSRNEFGIIE